MAEANSIESCSACRFFLAPHGAIGVCRRYPTHQNRHGNDWCGEFDSIPIKRTSEEHMKAVNEITSNALDILEQELAKQKSKRGRKPKVKA